MSRENVLFYDYDLGDYLAKKQQQMNSEIDRFNPNQLLNISPDDLADCFSQEFFCEPLEILENQISVDNKETQVEVTNNPNYNLFRGGPHYVTGTSIILEVPFTGDVMLFKCRPLHFNLSFPLAEVCNSKILITLNIIEHNPEQLKKDFSEKVNSIKWYLENINKELEPWNQSLFSNAKSRIEGRVSKLLKDQGLVKALGFPLKRSDDKSTTFAAPNVRQKIVPKMPTAKEVPYSPEPVLVMKEYEHIIEILKKTARVLERSPQVFKDMGEEDLRTQFLLPLNSHYEGQASGETFNFTGKTDILIQAADKAIFIAECKIWKGERSLSKAIDQLLSYSTWRDTKLSIIIFNRNKNLSSVLEKIPSTVHKHPNFKRELKYADETGFRYILGHRDDTNRELMLTILVFDVPI